MVASLSLGQGGSHSPLLLTTSNRTHYSSGVLDVAMDPNPASYKTKTDTQKSTKLMLWETMTVDGESGTIQCVI